MIISVPESQVLEGVQEVTVEMSRLKVVCSCAEWHGGRLLRVRFDMRVFVEKQ